MTFVVTENCIKCKYTDCVEVCPVDCFYEGQNMLVIHPDECIDCGVCQPECPADAIFGDDQGDYEEWITINRRYAEIWPVIASKIMAPADADTWKDKPDKLQLLSSLPGGCDPSIPANPALSEGRIQ